jgi:hypothetical protein
VLSRRGLSVNWCPAADNLLLLFYERAGALARPGRGTSLIIARAPAREGWLFGGCVICTCIGAAWEIYLVACVSRCVQLRLRSLLW